MLTYVPVVFDAYRPLKPHLRWTLQCLVGFADHDGRCFPSVRKLAAVTGISKSTVSRHLADLEKSGALTRRRRPGGCYSYQIDSRFLPPARASVGVSHQQKPVVSHSRDRAVPPLRTEEKSSKKKGDSPFDSEDFRWRARMRQWREFGLWAKHYGPFPGQPGCRVPPELLYHQGA